MVYLLDLGFEHTVNRLKTRGPNGDTTNNIGISLSWLRINNLLGRKLCFVMEIMCIALQ